jgi:transposase
MEPRIRVFAGVDWSRGHHDVCVVDEQGEVLAEERFAHSGEELRKLCEWLAKRAEPREVAVGIETSRGPVVETLMERGFVVHSINPKQMDRFRDRYSLAGSKNDRLDARVLADSLRTDRSCYRRLESDEPVRVELREWTRIADELQHERTRWIQRLNDQLWRYFPAALELTDDVGRDWFLELWQLAPTPSAAQALKAEQIEPILKSHRVRRIKASTVVERLCAAPLKLTTATVEATRAHAHISVMQLQLLNRQHREALKNVQRLTKQLGCEQAAKTNQRDVEILQSLPGVGWIVLATLCAEAAEPLRQRDYHALRALSGVAPVTRRSGKSHVVEMRRSCAARVRTAVYHWSCVAIRKDAPSRQKYRGLRARGQSHGGALRRVADRLLLVACSMLRSGQPYDPTRCTPAAFSS